MKTGRPKGINNKDCICSIRMDELTLRRLNAYCKKMKIPKSEAMRNDINSMIDSTEKQNK